MKRLLVWLVLCLTIPGALNAFGIVNRTATRDTLSIPFQVLDSLAKPVDLAGGDSVYVTVFSPGGTVVFKDSMAYDDASLKSYDWEDFNGGKHYAYTEQVSVLDGSSTADGVFTYILVVDDNTGADLITPVHGYFQIINSNFESGLDSAGLAAERSGRALDSLHLIIDSLLAALDTLQNQDDWVSSLTATDNIGINLDDVTGTLDAAEIGAGAVTAEKIATGAITGPKLASGAITAAAFTAGAITSGVISGDAIGASEVAAGAVEEIAREIWRNRDTAHVDSSDIGTWLVNNLQGGSGGTDSSSIARWVWNTPQANHTTAGTFGGYLDAEVSTAGSGSGLYAFGFQTYDSALQQVIPHVRLAIRNLDQTALVATGITGNDGCVDFNLDSDSFLVVAAATGYGFAGYDTVVVAGNGVDTIYGYSFDPGTPASPDLCRVYGFVSNVQGQPENYAAVSASLPRGVARSGNLLVSPFSVSTQTDSAGYFYLDVIPSDSLIGEDTRYEISISRQDGTILRRRFTVPATTSWQLVW